MTTTEKILEIEWEMFHSVNGDTRTDCQNDYSTFCRMRKAQYDVWSEKTLSCYLADMEQAKAADRNLAREKYIIMMKSTDPEGYEHFKEELPAASEKKLALIEEIWAIQKEQTLKMREKYPVIAFGGRPLSAAEEEAGWPSIETYQKSELLTYSEETLTSLLADIKELQVQGIDYAYKVQENSVLCLGYRSMDEAEQVMALQILQQFGPAEGGCACCCGGDEE